MLTILIRLLVITLLVYAGVQFWYGSVEKRLQKQVSPPKMVHQSQDTPVKTEPAVDESSSGALEIILTRNIFRVSRTGTGAPEAEKSETDIDQLTQTRLSLTLLGTVTGDHDDARAIIRDDKNRLEDLYRLGSEIQGATINRISRGKVVLLVNGREEVLIIKDREGGRGNNAVSVQQRQPVSVRASDEEINLPTPRATPRRRISFRSQAPKPPAGDPRELSEAPLEEEQPGAVEDVPPLPEENVEPPDLEDEFPEQESEHAVEFIEPR